ncbi:MAG: hypothetical protein KC800_14885 [Candidatus Eremiobacteraeota bacterium]|nr:hypothetical protein [Candidatus Eremiobacteraeota bacterium]
MSHNEDLCHLSEALGGPMEKVATILSTLSPDWRPHQPLTDRDILRVASLLGKGRHYQWKCLLGDLARPQVHPVEIPVIPGEILLSPQLTTSFHKEFVTSNFVEKLALSIADHPALAGYGASGYLIPSYNGEEYMGPQSVVKYRFNAAVVANRPKSPVKWQITYNLDYRPKYDNFRLRHFLLCFEWRLDILKQLLFERGLVSKERFDQAVSEAENSNRVYKLLGFASPVCCLLEHDESLDGEIQRLLVEVGGFASISDSQVSTARLLSDTEQSRTYQALLVEDEPLPFLLLSSASTVEEFEYLAGEQALPAFAHPGAIAEQLHRLTP